MPARPDNRPAMPSLRFVLTFVLALVCFAAPASATWSILIVDLATGEIAIGIATCLTGFDLQARTRSSSCPATASPRRSRSSGRSRCGETDPHRHAERYAGQRQILTQLGIADPGHQSRQYGIASLFGGSGDVHRQRGRARGPAT
jgi:hypothetical protein